MYIRNIGKSKCTKVPDYLLKYFNKIGSFVDQGKQYLISNTKFVSVVLLSDSVQPIAIIGPLNKIKNIHFAPSAIGTYEIGTPTTATYDYMVLYNGGLVQIKKDEKIWRDTGDKIIIGWHGSYSPPTDMN